MAYVHGEARGLEAGANGLVWESITTRQLKSVPFRLGKIMMKTPIIVWENLF